MTMTEMLAATIIATSLAGLGRDAYSSSVREAKSTANAYKAMVRRHRTEADRILSLGR